ncbi:MFS transporter [Macrococcoides caseolyticum]|uniref:MFS transporter n=1 Tax=Macrococcoides caseolyticum TaxID=69966 RepID=UPI000C34B04B|nr:MFS transporter [Macrococcus caseolyticus]PKE11363.1 MFS transporter [Macrococcus caseolyticus]PKE47461.1 MFS transporter [Macrococcus caseolyticus]PKF14316.1 MFS transporter [Macrococcus caseolyticus]TDM24211.1 MFS transporter [Macrococcus caseolyticus]
MTNQIRQSYRQIIILIVSGMICVLGVSIYSFGISFFILSTTGSAKLFSFNLAIGIIGRILATPVSGYLADHYNRKKVLIYAIFAEALIVSLLLLYVHFLGFHIIALYITTFLASYISSVSNPSLLSAMPNIVHEDHLQKTMGYNSTATSLSMLLGPAAGGLMYAIVSKEVFILCFIVAYIIAGSMMMSLNFNLFKKTESTAQNDSENIMQSFKFGIHYIWGHPILRTLIILFMSLNFFMSCINIGMGKIIIGHYGASSQMMGILEATFSIGILVGGLIIGSQKKFKSPFPILKGGLVVNSVCIMIVSIPLFIFDELWVVYCTFMIIGFIVGISGQYVNTPVMLYFQESIEEHVRGRIFSVIFLISQLLMPISYVIFGIIFDFGYYAVTFLICGALSLLLVLGAMNRSFNKKVNIQH